MRVFSLVMATRAAAGTDEGKSATRGRSRVARTAAPTPASPRSSGKDERTERSRSRSRSRSYVGLRYQMVDNYGFPMKFKTRGLESRLKILQGKPGSRSWKVFEGLIHAYRREESHTARMSESQQVLPTREHVSKRRPRSSSGPTIEKRGHRDARSSPRGDPTTQVSASHDPPTSSQTDEKQPATNTPPSKPENETVTSRKDVPQKPAGSATRRYLQGVGKSMVGVPVGVASGVAGIFSRPVDGAVEDGAVGALRGFGHAITGVIKTPLQAISDLADSVDPAKSAALKTNSGSKCAGNNNKSDANTKPQTPERKEKQRDDKKARRSSTRAVTRKGRFPGQSLMKGMVGLGKGLFKGVTGVFVKPIKQARRGGVAGFFRGFGSGLVGIIGQPVKGVVSFFDGLDASMGTNSMDASELRFGDVTAYRHAIRSGVPCNLRAALWDIASGARALRSKAGPRFFRHLAIEYDELLAAVQEGLLKGMAPEDEKCPIPTGDIEKAIFKDLDRTFPEHPLFSIPDRPVTPRADAKNAQCKAIRRPRGQRRRNPTGTGLEPLAEVLGAFARHKPSIGYCQGLNFVAATAILVSGSGVGAFWLLVALTENILPKNYYGKGLVGALADAAVLSSLVGEALPKIYAHCQSHGVPVASATAHWFVSLFSNALPIHVVVRIWDLVILKGRIFMFQFALALLRCNRGAILSTRCPGKLFNLLTGLGRTAESADDKRLMKKAAGYRLDPERVGAMVSEQTEVLNKRLATRQASLDDDDDVGGVGAVGVAGSGDEEETSTCDQENDNVESTQCGSENGSQMEPREPKQDAVRNFGEA